MTPEENKQFNELAIARIERYGVWQDKYKTEDFVKQTKLFGEQAEKCLELFSDWKTRFLTNKDENEVDMHLNIKSIADCANEAMKSFYKKELFEVPIFCREKLRRGVQPPEWLTIWEYGTKFKYNPNPKSGTEYEIDYTRIYESDVLKDDNIGYQSLKRLLHKGISSSSRYATLMNEICTFGELSQKYQECSSEMESIVNSLWKIELTQVEDKAKELFPKLLEKPVDMVASHVKMFQKIVDYIDNNSEKSVDKLFTVIQDLENISPQIENINLVAEWLKASEIICQFKDVDSLRTFQINKVKEMSRSFNEGQKCFDAERLDSSCILLDNEKMQFLKKMTEEIKSYYNENRGLFNNMHNRQTFKTKSEKTSYNDMLQDKLEIVKKTKIHLVESMLFEVYRCKYISLLLREKKEPLQDATNTSNSKEDEMCYEIAEKTSTIYDKYTNQEKETLAALFNGFYFEIRWYEYSNELQQIAESQTSSLSFLYHALNEISQQDEQKIISINVFEKSVRQYFQNMKQQFQAYTLDEYSEIRKRVMISKIKGIICAFSVDMKD